MVEAKTNPGRARDRRYRNKALLRLGIAVVVLIIVNLVSAKTFYRFDFTKEKRFTISSATKELLRSVQDNVYVAIYLKGDLPAEYRKLQKAVMEMLDEYNSYSGNRIDYDVVDPFDQPNDSLQDAFIRELTELGVQGRRLAEQSLEQTSDQVIFPGAVVFYGDRRVPLNFLPTTSGETSEGMVESALAMLEYNLSNTIRKLVEIQPKRIALVQGHGEASPAEVADIGEVLHFQQYEVAVLDISRNTIADNIDALIIAGPKTRFSEADKFKLDQYIMGGGKVLWLIDPLAASLDSLRVKEAQATMDYDLNLDDQLFTYGVRVNLDLVQDIACNPIMVGGEMRPWYLYPVFLPDGAHAITKHLDRVMGMFSSSIDTIRTPGVKKTILLASSAQSRVAFHPVSINLGLTQMPPELFTKAGIPVAVLLEGEFNSVFRNRQISTSFMQAYRDSLNREFHEKSVPTKMIVISDADMIRNVDWVGRGYAPLGRYLWRRDYVFANKDFLLNCIDYLTDSYGLITTRNKEFKIRPLNVEQVRDTKFRWQLLNLGLPVLLLLIFGGVFTAVRRYRYAR